LGLGASVEGWESRDDSNCGAKTHRCMPVVSPCPLISRCLPPGFVVTDSLLVSFWLCATFGSMALLSSASMTCPPLPSHTMGLRLSVSLSVGAFVGTRARPLRTRHACCYLWYFDAVLPSPRYTCNACSYLWYFDAVLPSPRYTCNACCYLWYFDAVLPSPRYTCNACCYLWYFNAVLPSPRYTCNACCYLWYFNAVLPSPRYTCNACCYLWYFNAVLPSPRYTCNACCSLWYFNAVLPSPEWRIATTRHVKMRGALSVHSFALACLRVRVGACMGCLEGKAADGRVWVGRGCLGCMRCIQGNAPDGAQHHGGVDLSGVLLSVALFAVCCSAVHSLLPPLLVFCFSL
jgi:hypothetical protein